jgi:conjugal transfer/entry exclusion protein
LCKGKPSISDQLQAIENQIAQLQMRPLHLQNLVLQKELEFQHHSTLTKDEAYHR